MATVEVQFRYETGLGRSPFTAATLTGSWTADGRPSLGPWSTVPMRAITCEDGTDGFAASVSLDEAAVGATFSWGVQLERGDGASAWGIFAETPQDSLQYRSFVLAADAAAPGVPHRERYRLSWHHCRGAHRWSAGDGQADAIRFSVWAPNAQAVAVVFGGASGYIADDGYGQDQSVEPLGMARSSDDREVWEALATGFEQFIGRRYLFRITREDGSVNWATDMFSREQCGEGDQDPAGAHYDGTPAQLDGRPSCSEVIDPSLVGAYPVRPGAPPQPEADFWADEHPPDRNVPTQVADLVIYELHVGALGPQSDAAGTFADAIELLPYLEQLGVNAIELMPMLQFDGTLSWGYGSSHFLAIESAAGGRHALKHFVKACHQHGIAVIMDVVYNHYTPQAARAAWQYDSTAAHNNIYYWYEGDEHNYPNPEYGYVDNVSSGWAPRYHDDHVRALFVSSAVCLLDEYHMDGLRVDQTASIHAYNALHGNGSPLPDANVSGRKFLRELCQTVKTVWPDSLLIAEDHSHWPPVTQPATSGGIGFDATWYVDFFHHLVGEQSGGPEWAKLLLSAARDPSGPLHLDWFAGALSDSGERKVVYEESHDEAGNDRGTERTILAAVGGAPLIGSTRRYAEARCRFACAMTMLSAGTPMFLMGEEVGAEKAYTYDKFQENKEDLEGERRTTGAHLFRFYQDVIALRRSGATWRSANIEVLHADDDTRVLAFRRWDADRELLVVGSLNNGAFDQPSYRISHPDLRDGTWVERLNSDAGIYGGAGVGNPNPLEASGGALEVVLPANGTVVFERAAGA
jgi:1,4-alpha-glucan branching enzyme